ncbi:hypothetical protein IEQ34_013075 [Dendrobium chrysotoxum]|uniref:Uncharacterized protein n=1 Tax=Dendrobium chrysotoxum TaxID=161865 RepID=A0AAV7GQF9_DENCH|nr:hypothetical protein IEQ34_013075 [Dendrobium chrysotoxum]
MKCPEKSESAGRKQYTSRKTEIRHALKEVKAVGGEERVVAGEEDLDRARGPPEHLMQSIGEIDGRGAAKCVAASCDAVNGAPAAVVHAVAGDYVLGDGAINPANAVTPLGFVFEPAGDDCDGFGDGGGGEWRARYAKEPWGAAIQGVPEAFGEEGGIEFGVVKGLGAEGVGFGDDKVRVVGRRRIGGGGRRVETIEGEAAEDASGPDSTHVAIKKYRVIVGITIIRVNSFEALRELNEANILTTMINEEAHRLADGHCIIDIVVAIKYRGMVSFPMLRRRHRPSPRPMRPISHPSRLFHLHHLYHHILFTGRRRLLHPPHLLHLLPRVKRIGPPPYRIRQAINPHLKLIILPLHSPPIPHKILPPLILRRIPPQAKVTFRVPRLNVVFAAEGDPQSCESGSLSHSLEGEKGAAVVREIAGKLIDGVIGGEDGEDGVGRNERGFLVGIGGGDEDVDGWEVGGGGGGGIELVAEGGEVGGAVDGVEFGELVEDP